MRVEEKLGKGDSLLLNHDTIYFPRCFFFLVKLWKDWQKTDTVYNNILLWQHLSYKLYKVCLTWGF